MKNSFYLIGNSTCSNRGDGAILRGLITELEDSSTSSPVNIKIISRFPKSARWFLQREVSPDLVYELNKSSGSMFQKMKSKISKFLTLEYLFLLLKYSWIRKFCKVPKKYSKFIDDARDFDHILQVGGSFFIDYYGLIQFEALMVLLLFNKRITLVGHSLGPFKSSKSRRFALLVLSKIDVIFLREEESLLNLEEIGYSGNNIKIGADTAWLIPDSTQSLVANAELDGISKPIIAFTFRELKPFDIRLGTTQEEYEKKIVNLINFLTREGYHIIVLSMCTGLDSYGYDDRMVGLRVKTKIANPSNMSVLMNEYTDLELGYLLDKCELLIGTRLHSVILSLRYGTPAFAIYYEHKSLGTLKMLELEEFSILIKEIDSLETRTKINSVLKNQNEVKARIKKGVGKQILIGKSMISELN